MSNVLLSLAFLACPVGMGLMMWFMGRGVKQDRGGPEIQQVAREQPASLEVLREEQARLGAEIDRLEGRAMRGERSGVAGT